MDQDYIVEKIAPNNILRIGINLGNSLLVNKLNQKNIPEGLSPDIGKRIAKELGVEYKFILFNSPGSLADSVNDDLWDIGNIAHEPERGLTIDFSNPYINIDANFLIRKKNFFLNNNDIKNKKVNIIVHERIAYDLWLT